MMPLTATTKRLLMPVIATRPTFCANALTGKPLSRPPEIVVARMVPSMRPYGRSSAWKTSFLFSRPYGLRSTTKWCLLGIENRTSAISGWPSMTASPIAYRVCCSARL